MRRRLIRRPRKNPSHAGWAVFCWTILLVTLVRSLEAEPPVAVGGPKSVTVSVVDERTGQPVSDFAYRIAIVTTDLRRSDEPGPWQSVQASQGDFQVQVPRSCQLRVTVRARGYCDFWGGEEITKPFLIRSQEEHPRVQMRITRGRTVRGVVRDAETGVPVAGAKVRPYRVRRASDRARFAAVGNHGSPWQVRVAGRHAGVGRNPHRTSALQRQGRAVSDGA